jgi:hypothetical protein
MQSVAVMLFFSTFRQYIPEPQFVEMTWGSITSQQSAIPNLPTEQTSARPEASQDEQTDNSVAMPSRRYLDLQDEVISVKQNKKSISTDAPSNSKQERKDLFGRPSGECRVERTWGRGRILPDGQAEHRHQKLQHRSVQEMRTADSVRTSPSPCNGQGEGTENY